PPYKRPKPAAPAPVPFLAGPPAQSRLRITARFGKAAPDYRRWMYLRERSPRHRLPANVGEWFRGWRAIARARGARIRCAACAPVFRKKATGSLRLSPQTIPAKPPTGWEYQASRYGSLPSAHCPVPEHLQRRCGCQTDGKRSGDTDWAKSAVAAGAI